MYYDKYLPIIPMKPTCVYVYTVVMGLIVLQTSPANDRFDVNYLPANSMETCMILFILHNFTCNVIYVSL